MDRIAPTPRNRVLGLLADTLAELEEKAKSVRQPNPLMMVPSLLGGQTPQTAILNLLGVPALQKTVERMSYGEPLTTGRGMTTRPRQETTEAALLAAGIAGPAAKAGEKAAMTVGKAGERLAERAVPAVMERGGLPAEMMQAMGQGSVSPLIVYHGSPAKFQRFDPTKIGSGEGAQSYGYGHYVAENPKVAKGYKEKLSRYGELVTKEGDKIYIPDLPKNSADQIAAEIWIKNPNLQDAQYVLSNLSSQYFPKDVKKTDVLKSIEELNKKGASTSGSLYTIDLPDKQIARMLDWDKKFSEQPENVQRGIIKYWSENPGLKYYGRPEQMTGEGIYGSVKAASLGPESGARINLNPANQAAAMDLRYQGIPGIRYLDQGSRGAGQGTSNFVVFPGEEELLRILERNGVPITSLLD